MYICQADPYRPGSGLCIHLLLELLETLGRDPFPIVSHLDGNPKIVGETESNQL